MEKYYLVTDESSLRKNYLDFLENEKIVKEFTDRFFKKHNISSNSYYPTSTYLHIIPTKEDEEKFGKQLCKKSNNGLKAFKKNSLINKDWLNCARTENIEFKIRPHLSWYFGNIFGGCSFRLFEIDGNVYCSYSCSYDFKNPTGFLEMKASEFFKLIEEYQI